MWLFFYQYHNPFGNRIQNQSNLKKRKENKTDFIACSSLVNPHVNEKQNHLNVRNMRLTKRFVMLQRVKFSLNAHPIYIRLYCFVYALKRIHKRCQSMWTFPVMQRKIHNPTNRSGKSLVRRTFGCSYLSHYLAILLNSDNWLLCLIWFRIQCSLEL